MYSKIEEMKALNAKLIEASNAYYNLDTEIMSNFEYDKLYDELVNIESETGIVLSNSITKRVGSEVVSSLKKAKHNEKMLSLAKTKSIDEVIEWANGNDICLSWKLDGLTVVLTYDKGELVSAITRGNGEIGEDITEQAKHFNNIPLNIPCKNKIVVRGEAVITYSEFDRINENMDADSQFKNPRNLASGTVKSLDLSVLDERKVSWIAFTFVKGYKSNSYSKQLDELSNLGFDVVEHKLVKENINENIENFSAQVSSQDIPVDGLVLFIDDTEYGKSLGNTSHHPRCAMAFKWEDEEFETTLREIEWNRSRTGRINPVAIFDEVEIDGTSVTRASLHNLTYIEDMKLNIGDTITVYKANMIIPQIAENKTKSLKNINELIPKRCPACGGKVKVVKENNASFLICENKNCSSNLKDEIVLMTSSFKIMGIGNETIQKLIEVGVLKRRSDIFSIKNHKEEYCNIEGLGEKSFDSLINEIENVNIKREEFISAFGIPGVSKGNAKAILKEIGDIYNASYEDILAVKGMGDKTAKNFTTYISNHIEEMKYIESMINIIDVKQDESISLISGKSFAVTGKVYIFKNRKELETTIESNGAELKGVSKGTDYLITNDPHSGSAKNKKAQELGIQLITEQEFIDMLK